MSSANDEDIKLLNPEGTQVLLRTHAGPWRDKQEFDAVYDWIYGENSTRETKEKACRQMTIWKLRRLSLTPGTILSTILILEAELKDETYSQTTEGAADICTIYSSALSRFINYMSAISHSNAKPMKTMYGIARDLNLEPFLIDLRHLCAHGYNMPKVEVFRRTSKYCLDWLREFYWETQKQTMTNVDAKDVRHKDSTNFEANVREMFLVYDAATGALSKKCIKVSECKKYLSAEKLTILKLFATESNEESLDTLKTLALKRISTLVKRGHRLKDLSQIFLDALLEMSYFFEAGIGDEVDEKSLIARHQRLFKTMAFNGFIEDLYYLLVEIAEDEFENVIRREGAAFWAKQIVIGFIAFKKIKVVYKKQLEENCDEKLSLSTVNEKYVARNVIEVYKDFNIDVEGTLIFGDTIKCPWALSFSRQYIMERIEHINEYTEEMIKSCLHLIEPPLSDKENRNLMFLIDQYSAGVRLEINSENSLPERVFTLQEDVLKNKTDDVEMTEIDSDPVQSKNTFGIWTQVSDGQEWYSCPLGRLMWE